MRAGRERCSYRDLPVSVSNVPDLYGRSGVLCLAMYRRAKGGDEQYVRPAGLIRHPTHEEGEPLWPKCCPKNRIVVCYPQAP
jgi:hypothetical protein